MPDDLRGAGTDRIRVKNWDKDFLVVRSQQRIPPTAVLAVDSFKIHSATLFDAINSLNEEQPGFSVL